MFIKEFMIRRYGPLPESGRIKPGLFNLFYGPNEDGKTLTIDALLRLLFGKEILSYFKQAGRVAENPEGYVVLANGTEKKLPEAGLLSDFYALDPREFSRVFVIRDSDLSISSEGDFYRHMTSRLTGLRTFEIRNVMAQVQALGHLTPKKALQNAEPYKFKERLFAAEKLLEKVLLLQNKLKAAGFSRLEEELARLKQKQVELKERLREFRAALRRDQYFKGRGALDRLSEVQSRLSALAACQKEDYLTWQRAAARLSQLLEVTSKQKGRLTELQQNFALTKTRVKDLARAAVKAKQDYEEAAKTLEPLLSEHEARLVALQQREVFFKSSFYTPALIVSMALFFLTLAGVIFKPSWWVIVIFAFAALFFLAGSAGLFWLQLTRSRQQAFAQKVKFKAAGLGLKTGSVEQIRLALVSLNQDNLHAKEELLAGEKEGELLEREITRLNSDLEENQERMALEEAKIGAVKRSSGMKTLEEFAAGLEQKESMVSEQKAQLSLLSSHFNPQEKAEAKNGEPDLAYWEEKVEEHASYKEAAPGISYNQARSDEVRQNLTELEEQQSLLLEAKQEYSKELQLTENNYNEIMQFEGAERLLCQTVVDLEKIIEMLQAWLSAHHSKVAAAKQVLTILEELEEEEEKKVSELFGENSPVSSYFSKVTAGCYRSVHFQGADQPLLVTEATGVSFDALSLSGGAYDQLYFAIRLALAKKLLATETGFFILDDPLIKADAARLPAMLKMLLEISLKGWQIFYFSAKQEIKEALKRDIAGGRVHLFGIGLSDTLA